MSVSASGGRALIGGRESRADESHTIRAFRTVDQESHAVRVDLHTHILPERWPDWTRRSGYPGWIALDHCGPGCARMCRSNADGSTTFFREIGANCWDPSVRLGEMDATGVAMQVLSTVPVMFSYWAAAKDALDLARLLNDHIAGIVRAHPSRFAGLGTVPMQDAGMACRELERCVEELGMRGVQIGTNVNGLNLDEPGVFEVLACAERLGAAVFVHPWEMLQHQLMRAPGGVSGSDGVRSVDRMSRYWMPWLVGMPCETTIAMMSVMFGGVLDRWPRLKIAFAHGGGSFPGTLGRIVHGFECRRDLFPEGARDPRAYLAGEGRLARVYVDSLVHDAEALRLIVRQFGASRVALGSDYPFPLGEARPGELVWAMRGELGEDVVERLMRGTARELLGILDSRTSEG